MPSVHAVLFDLDETFWPIIPVIMQAENILFDWMREHAPAVTARHSIASLREQRKAMAGEHASYAYNLQMLRRHALEKVFTECGEDPRKVELAMQLFDRERNQVTPYDDVHPVLDALKLRVRLGTITNGSADLEAIGLAPYFQSMIAANRYGSAKPDPSIFHAACAELGVSPEKAVYVGDDPAMDVAAASAAGLQTVWVNRSNVAADQVMPAEVYPDLICTTLHELLPWLQDRLASPTLIKANP